MSTWTGPSGATSGPTTGPNTSGPTTGPNTSGPITKPNTSGPTTGPNITGPTTGPYSGPTKRAVSSGPSGASSGPTGATGASSGPTGATGASSGPTAPPPVSPVGTGQYGPATISSIVTSDLVAPGVPTFVALKQSDNKIIQVTVAIPTMDANGDSLSGLTKLTVATTIMTGGTNPFANKSMTEILAMAGIQRVDTTLSSLDAGQQKVVNVNVMNLGGVQAFAAACSDEAPVI